MAGSIAWMATVRPLSFLPANNALACRKCNTQGKEAVGCTIPFRLRAELHSRNSHRSGWPARRMQPGLSRGSAQSSRRAATNSTPLDGVLLDFSATWCGPCQKMSPIVTRLQQQGYPVRKVDVDQERQLAECYGIKTIPCFVLVVSGREVMRRSGETSETQLRHMLMQIPEYQREMPQTPPGAGEWKLAENTNEAGTHSPFAVDLAEPSAPPEKMARAEPPKAEPPKAEPMKAEPVKKESGFTFPLLPKFKGKKPEKESVAEPYIARGEVPQEPLKTPAPSTASVHTRLRVKDQGGVNFGSGTVIDSRIGRSLILTCGHLFRDLKPGATVEVDLFDRNRKPETLVGQVVDYDLTADVGLVAIPTRSVLQTVSLSALDRALQRGEKVMSVGCGGGELPSGEALEITAINKYDGPDNVECTGVPVRGRSGGGLFRGEELIGVCIAADPKEKRGLYCGLKPVYALVEKAGFGNLLPTTRPEIVPTSNPASVLVKADPTPSPLPRGMPFRHSIPVLSRSQRTRCDRRRNRRRSIANGAAAIARCRSDLHRAAKELGRAQPRGDRESGESEAVELPAGDDRSHRRRPEGKSDLIPTSATAMTSANREFQSRVESAPRRPQSPRPR